MDLCEPLLRGISSYGTENPTDIQKRALKPCISGYDVIAQAPSCKGKTTMFIIAILQKLNVNCKDCQALILVPSRELAQGIRAVVLALGDYMNVTCHACIGGTHIREDMKRLEAGVQVVVGTPGRIYDMLKTSVLRSENIEMFVLDNVDELLSRGFKDQVYDVLTMLSRTIQGIIVSATMSSELLEIAAKFMNDPVKILTKREEYSLESIRQFYVDVEREDWKLDTLYDLLDILSIPQAVIFCNELRTVTWLTEKLRAHNITVSTVYYDMDAQQCNDAIKEFRVGSSRILLRTDTLKVDIDIAQFYLVINYDLPNDCQIYINRIGRSGKFGRKSVAINFITKDEQRTLHDIEQYYNTKIEELPMNIADLI
ncbi:unnamed protein product [Adineta steineri]|uniref:RNA helicase n=1 Tax=Adineta steineri TaxID=433720 RepID=A0A818RS01_9BILA|nr:unnamed protein product [Adineta steineri]